MNPPKGNEYDYINFWWQVRKFSVAAKPEEFNRIRRMLLHTIRSIVCCTGFHLTRTFCGMKRISERCLSKPKNAEPVHGMFYLTVGIAYPYIN